MTKRLSLMKGLLSKMSPKLKLLDLTASLFGTLSELDAIAMYLICTLFVNDALLASTGRAALIGLSFWGYVGIILALGLFKGPFRYAEQYLNHQMAFHMLAEVRHQIYESLQRLAPAKLEGKKSGDLLSLVTADIETLEIFYAHTLSPILIGLLSSLAVLLTGGILGGFPLASLYLATFLLIGFAFPSLGFRLIGDNGEAYRGRFSSFSAFLLENLNLSLPLLQTGREEERLAQVKRRSDQLNDALVNIKWRNAVQVRSQELFLGLVSLAYAAFAVAFLLQQPENPLPALLSILFFPGAYRPALALGALPGNLSNTYASAERYLSLLNEKPAVEENEDGEEAPPLVCLEFQNVSFSYPDEPQRLILKGVNLSIPAKGIVGIEGPSGNGKTTLLNLVLRHRDPTEGRILWNGIPLCDIESDSLREKIAFMNQDTILFEESLKDNLKEAKPSASDEEIAQALAQASLSPLLKSLPEGLDTILSEGSGNVSSGEKQRIGLARILLRNTSLVLLDEPTSNVDGKTEEELLATFRRMGEERAVVIVSHRPTTLSIASAVYAMDEGTLHKKER